MQWVPVFYFFNNTFKIHTVWIWRIVLSLTALLYLPFPSVCHREVLLVLYLVWLWRWKPTLQLTWMNVDCRPGSGSYQLATINFCMTRSVPLIIVSHINEQFLVGHKAHIVENCGFRIGLITSSFIHSNQIYLRLENHSLICNDRWH